MSTTNKTLSQIEQGSALSIDSNTLLKTAFAMGFVGTVALASFSLMYLNAHEWVSQKGFQKMRDKTLDTCRRTFQTVSL